MTDSDITFIIWNDGHGNRILHGARDSYGEAADAAEEANRVIAARETAEGRGARRPYGVTGDPAWLYVAIDGEAWETLTQPQRDRWTVLHMPPAPEGLTADEAFGWSMFWMGRELAEYPGAADARPGWWRGFARAYAQGYLQGRMHGSNTGGNQPEGSPAFEAWCKGYEGN